MRSARSGRVRLIWPYVGLFVLAFALRLWMPGPVESTTDEPLWLTRSAQFSEAIADGDLDSATAWDAVAGLDYPTMPGVTTMWAGTAGRELTSLGHRVGLNAPLPDDPLASTALLRWSKSMVALMVSCGLVLFTWSATRLVGRAAGFVAGLLGAIEPWFVGHSFLIHTDALVTVFGTTSIIAMAAAFRRRNPEVSDPTPAGGSRALDPAMVAVSAVTGGLAIATKMNGLVIVGGGVAIVAVVETVRRVWRTPMAARRNALGRLLGWGAAWFVGLVAVFVAVWPAVWVQPGAVVEHLRESVAHPAPIAAQFFMGEATHDPGIWFYPVTLAFRLSPWMLIGTGVAIILGLARLGAHLTRRTSMLERLPRLPWVVVAALFPYAVVISGYTRKYDRYALVFVPMFTLLVGVLVVDFAERLRPHWEGVPRRWLGAAGTAVLLLPTVYVASQAPYAISYVDPMLGGQKTAERVMLLGWGEGAAPLGKELAGREAGHCDEVKVVGPGSNLTDALFPCGRKTTLDELGVGGYVVLIANQVQRGTTPAAIEDRYGLTLQPVDSTVVDGVAYASLFQVTAKSPAA